MSDATLPSGPWLNVGSGPSAPAGWISLDGSWQARLAGHTWLTGIGRRALGIDIGHWPRGVVYRDIRHGLGYADHSVAVVYSSHTLEHLHRIDALGFLRRARAALKPGGICRIVVPDVHAIVGWYLEHTRQPAAQQKESSSDLLMNMMLLRSPHPRSGNPLVGMVRRSTDLHEHKWMYDAAGLRALFEEAGFTSPSVRHLESAIPRLDRLIAQRANAHAGEGSEPADASSVPDRPK